MTPQVLTHLNLAVDGRTFPGRCSGMALREASFKVTSVDPDIMAFFGIADDNGFNGVFRGSYKEQGGTKKAVVATIRGLLKEINPGAWTPGQKSEYTYSVSCNYYKLEIDGQVIHEIDPVNMIRIINGVDELAQERANLGI